ncbi:MAG: GGDEF domain-containing protein [Janthinobacterium lividum]
MGGAVFALTANIVIALLVAGAFFGLARIPSTFPGVSWFGVTYATGALTPISELLVRAGPVPSLFHAASFASFCLAFHFMAKGLSVYFNGPLPRWLLPASFIACLLLGASIWHGRRDSFGYELCYQIPFTWSLGICVVVLLRIAPPRRLNKLLTVVFLATSLHFLFKPLAAIALGTGATERDYIFSRYALFSQALSCLLFIAVALTLILVVIHDTLEAVHWHADRDLLSGLSNRRAFDRECIAALRVCADDARGVAMMFDLDHFKSINDSYGHATGDRVIQAFGAILQAMSGRDMIVGRTGGEEFAVFARHSMPSGEAGRFADEVRHRLAELSFEEGEGPRRVTVSCGIAPVKHGDTLNSLMARADRALYSAKSLGRDQFVEVA